MEELYLELSELENSDLQEILNTVDSELTRQTIIDVLNDRGHEVIKTSFRYVVYWNGLQ